MYDVWHDIVPTLSNEKPLPPVINYNNFTLYLFSHVLNKKLLAVCKRIKNSLKYKLRSHIT